MLNEDFLKYLVSLGVGGSIAGLLFMFYRKDVRFYTDQWKGQSEMLMEVVKENIKAITSNTEVIRNLMDKLGK